MDENAISVKCAISGCFARVVNDVRCAAHGGSPVYEWTPSEWGDPNEVDRTDQTIGDEVPELVTVHPQKGA